MQQVRTANGLGYAWHLPPNLKGRATTAVFDVASGRVLKTVVAKDVHAPVPLIAF